MYLKFLIFLSLFIYSCSSSLPITGKYVNRDDFKDVTLFIYSDSTFDYQQYDYDGVMEEYFLTSTKGQWTQVNDTIYLESIFNNIHLYNYTAENIPSYDSLYITTLEGPTGMELPLTSVVGKYNDAIVLDTTVDMSGKLSIPKQELDSLILSFYSLDPIHHPMDTSEGNAYFFEMEFMLYLNFDKKIFIRKGRNLIGTERKFRQWK